MDLNSLIMNNKVCMRCVGRLFPSSDRELVDRSIHIAKTELENVLLDNCVAEPECEVCEGLVLSAIQSPLHLSLMLSNKTAPIASPL